MFFSVLNIVALDPLEQFLTLLLFPGCPVNNWDSGRWVPIIGGLFIISFFICFNISFFKLGSQNLWLISIFNKININSNAFFSIFVENLLIDRKRINLYKCTTIIIKFINIFTNSDSDKRNLISILFIKKSFSFIVNLIKENLQTTTYLFLPIYYFSFLVILTLNLLGLLPYSITATSSFILILNYSFSILIGLNIICVYLYSVKYFNQFLPEGVPLFIAPVLVLIELFSSVIRIFSLTVRLFANILAGHSLLKIMIGVSWYCISLFIFFLPITVIIWLLLVPVFILEVIIAFLQAYVYVLLLIIYTNDVLNIH